MFGLGGCTTHWGVEGVLHIGGLEQNASLRRESILNWGQL